MDCEPAINFAALPPATQVAIVIAAALVAIVAIWRLLE